MDDSPGAITRETPVRDAVFGEPLRTGDGEFGVCVGEGVHASRWGGGGGVKFGFWRG